MQGVKLIRTQCYQEFKDKHINVRVKINKFDKNQETSIETWELRAFNKIDEFLEKVMPATFMLIILYLILNIISLMINRVGYLT